MPNTVKITKLLDGPRNAVFHVFLQSDGSGELTDYTLIDPTVDFNPALPARPIMTIQEIWYTTVGFDLRLEFDSLVDNQQWVIGGNSGNGSGTNHICFNKFGGLKDRGGLDSNGKLLITTTGFTTANVDQGSLVLMIRKD